MTTPNDPYASQPAPEHGAPQPAVPPQQQHAYYGRAPYYGPPTPNPPSRGAWFAIGAASMFGVGLVGLFGFFLIVGLLLGDDFDNGGSEDGYSYYYVDQRSVLKAVNEPCEDMIDAGKKLKPFDEPKQAAVGIEAFAATAQKVADAIGTADPDNDSQLWREDWEALAGNLEEYADSLASAGRKAEFAPLVPMGEAPLMFRMAFSSDANCEVPAIVEALDTANAGTYSDYYY